jgi:hypothetical protein
MSLDRRLAPWLLIGALGVLSLGDRGAHLALGIEHAGRLEGDGGEASSRGSDVDGCPCCGFLERSAIPHETATRGAAPVPRAAACDRFELISPPSVAGAIASRAPPARP